MSEHEDCVNCGITEYTNRLMKKRIAQLEGINAELEKASSYSLLKQNEKLKAENARLLKDSKRLDFVMKTGAVINPVGDPAHAYRLDWCDSSGAEPRWKTTNHHATWRDSIDEALHEGSCVEANDE